MAWRVILVQMLVGTSWTRISRTSCLASEVDFGCWDIYKEALIEMDLLVDVEKLAEIYNL